MIFETGQLNTFPNAALRADTQYRHSSSVWASSAWGLPRCFPASQSPTQGRRKAQSPAGRALEGSPADKAFLQVCDLSWVLGMHRKLDMEATSATLEPPSEMGGVDGRTPAALQALSLRYVGANRSPSQGKQPHPLRTELTLSRKGLYLFLPP